MDINSFDIEFYDFENASEEEIKEIHAILKGPGTNGCVELPWETTLKENFTLPECEKENTVVEKTDPSLKSTKCLGSMVGPALQFQAPLSPPGVPPPTVEAFIAPPTTVGPFPNPPYIVSRTIPYLRAYHHMGMPFFACPIAGNTGEASPLPSPYGQFVPVVPANVAQEKFIGDSESSQKSRPPERQYNRRSKKKSSPDYSTSYESETVADTYREVALGEAVSSPAVSSDRPTTVSLVPLPVPPSTFGVAGGTIPLHGYPPGLHTLPYSQMTGPQAPSAPMYYVPVFNHPYSSYLPSPSAPVVLPVNLHTDSPPVSSTCVVSVADPAKTSEIVPSNCEEEDRQEPISEETAVAAKNTSEGEDITDCNSSSDYPNSKSVSSSPDYITGLTADEFYGDKCATGGEDVKRADSSRCWADLFKKPHAEVNGIDHQQRGVRDKDELYTNGNASTSDVH